MPRYETLGNDPLRTVTPEPKKQSWQSDETLFAVCESLWEFLLRGAQEDENGAYWQGPVSNWFKDNKKSNLYSPIMYLMKEMGSCYIETKGSRWAGTVVRLVQPPTLEALKGVRRERFFYERPTINRRDANAIMMQRIDDLSKKVDELSLKIKRLESRY